METAFAKTADNGESFGKIFWETQEDKTEQIKTNQNKQTEKNPNQQKITPNQTDQPTTEKKNSQTNGNNKRHFIVDYQFYTQLEAWTC